MTEQMFYEDFSGEVAKVNIFSKTKYVGSVKLSITIFKVKHFFAPTNFSSEPLVSII